MATFLRRADRIDLHAAAIDEVEASFQDTFAALEHRLEPGFIRQAAAATGGYPFLIQLVGYHLWQLAEAVPHPLVEEDIHMAIAAAHRRNTRVVINAALATTSPKDLELLHAMAEDDGPSSVGDIGKRLEDRTNTIGNYRLRLIDAWLVQPAGRGKLDFAIPGLREHLRGARAK